MVKYIIGLILFSVTEFVTAEVKIYEKYRKNNG